MNFLDNNCTFFLLNQETIRYCNAFSCDREDLDDFFNNDALDYSSQLLGKTYCFRLNKDDKTIVCAFTVSNSSLKAFSLSNNRRRKVEKDVPRIKHLRDYPAVLVGRLGVHKDFKRMGVGHELMDFIKAWFISPQNKTGCRYILVDAYNAPDTIGYYQKNGFSFVLLEESEEKKYYHTRSDEPLKTRLMYFDLIKLFD